MAHSHVGWIREVGGGCPVSEWGQNGGEMRGERPRVRHTGPK